MLNLEDNLLVLGDRGGFIVRIVTVVMQLLKDLETFLLVVDPGKVAR